MYNLEGSVALVTGGGAGIGRAIALRLAEEGSAVAVLDRDLRGAEATVADVRTRGVKAVAVQCDVSDRADVERGAGEVARSLGDVHILVNNAGIIRLAPLLAMAPEDWHTTFRVNVDGMFHCCQVVGPQMVTRGEGRIINIASWFGKIGRPFCGAYCASKFAVIGFTQTLALELARHGVTVNAVCPGLVTNTALRDYSDEVSKQYGLPTGKEREGSIPLGRLAQPEDVARTVAFLASGEARYMTGQAINVTGGLWLH